ncbi:Glycosyl hydrolases family 16 [Abditibacterium utsteinense]|uniref:Glycosyl hydrolases family 16 n=1 Tax=Abditibacterium utsteinense TaxID=1960156 RepID=A0A2S8SWP0_9BACT|nr:glycoside hydrolase family 16 protein [Abditibacterium utsteinense]PQV65226.1 Glycosyl hydrolases family 16 [Abditibacterium utsteinense]
MLSGSVALAALLAGCGGGGGGGSTPAPPTSALLLRDDFDGTSLNSNMWGHYDESQSLQRTYFGFSPQLLSEGGTSFARLRLDAYNPTHRGQFKGTEIFSKRRFARGNGLEMSARLRAPNLPPGIIFAFFGIYDRFTGTPSDATYLKDEIDFEFLTAQQEKFSPPGQRNRLYFNIWDNWNLRDGFDGDDIDTQKSARTDKTYAPAKDPNYDYGNWNTYTLRWFPDRTEFYLNGVLERIEREVKPDDALSVHFNMWTGTPDFEQAYSTSLVPATASENNKSYFFDVDFVSVKDISGGAQAQNAREMAAPLPSSFKAIRSR